MRLTKLTQIFLLSAPLFVCVVPLSAYAAESAPFASTIAPTLITEKSARVNCRINPGEMNDTYYWVEWAIANNGIFYETTHTITGAQLTNVGVDLVGLAPSTSYNYRCVAENSHGKDTGVTTYFLTKSISTISSPIVIVQTLQPTAITETGAMLKGYASPHGTYNAEHWFEWGTSQALGNSTYHGTQAIYSGQYDTAITGLSPGTTYYVRAVGKNDAGPVVGQILSFKTLGTAVVSGTGSIANGVSGNKVETVTAKYINETNADLGAVWDTTIPFGYVFIEYGDNRQMEMKTSPLYVSSKSQADIPVLSLKSGTTYYYRAVFQQQQDSGTRIVGETKSFTTKQSPTLVTQAGSSITQPQGVSSGAIPFSPVPGVVPNTSITGATPANQQGAIGVQSGQPKFVNPLTYFGNFFGFNKSSAGDTSTSSTANPAKNSNAGNGNPAEQTAAVAETGGIFSKFWSSVTKSNSLKVNIATNTSGKAHSTVEYTIRYANESTQTYKNATLKVVYPKNVIYIGDDTSNEFMVEESSGSPERTYVLRLNNIEPGNFRTITMLGVMTSDTSISPDARARIEYTDNIGAVVSQKATAISADALLQMTKNDTARKTGVVTESSGGGFSLLPHSFIGWIVYTLVAVLVVVLFVRMRAYYLVKKKEIEEQEKQSMRTKAA